MTPVGITVFVEGESDKRFVECLSNHLDIRLTKVAEMGGGVNALRNVELQIVEEVDDEHAVGIIIDANAEVDKRRAEAEGFIQDLVGQHQLRIAPRLFLLPNDSDPGCLEDLLEGIAPAHRQHVYQCLDAYTACVRREQPSFEGPTAKGRVYAYCDALSTPAKPEERDYADGNCWDLNAECLSPLTEFLGELAAAVAPRPEPGP